MTAPRPATGEAQRRLGDLPLFADLSPALRDEVIATAIDRRVDADQTILLEGAESRHVFVLVEGSALVSLNVGGAGPGPDIRGEEGADLAVGTVAAPPARLLGWSSLLPASPHHATVRSLTPCRVLAVPRVSVERAFEADPPAEAAVLRRVLGELATRIGQALEVELVPGSADRLRAFAPSTAERLDLHLADPHPSDAGADDHGS